VRRLATCCRLLVTRPPKSAPGDHQLATSQPWVSSAIWVRPAALPPALWLTMPGQRLILGPTTETGGRRWLNLRPSRRSGVGEDLGDGPVDDVEPFASDRRPTAGLGGPVVARGT